MTDKATENSLTSNSKEAKAFQAARSQMETLFLAGLITVALLAAIWLIYLTPTRAIPAMGISFLFGIVVATLAYAFLGANGDDSFTIKGIRITGAAAVVAAVVYLANGALETQLGLANRIGALGQQVHDTEARATLAEAQANRLIIVDPDTPGHIAGGALVELVDVNTLNGLHEGRPFTADATGFHVPNGEHSVNRNRPEAARILAMIFRRLDIDRRVPEVLQMTQEQWDAFQNTLPEVKRNSLSQIPFATLSVHASDGHIERKVVFKNDEIPVMNRRNEVEAYLCIQRVLDTRTASNEPEAVVLTQSRTHCL